MIEVFVNFKYVLVASFFWLIFVVLPGSYFIFKFGRYKEYDLFELFGISLYSGLAFWSIVAFFVRLIYPYVKLGLLVFLVLYGFLLIFLFVNFREYLKFLREKKFSFSYFLILWLIGVLFLFYGLPGQGWAWDEWVHNSIIKKIQWSGYFDKYFVSIFGKDFPIPTYILSSYHFLVTIFLQITGLEYYKFNHSLSFLFLFANASVFYHFFKYFFRGEKKFLLAFVIYYFVMVYLGSFIFVERFLWFAPLNFFTVPNFLSPYVVAILLVLLFRREFNLFILFFYGYLFLAFTFSHLLYYIVFLFFIFSFFRKDMEGWVKYLILAIPGLVLVFARYYLSRTINPDIYYLMKGGKEFFISQQWAPFFKFSFGITFYGKTKYEFFKHIVFLLALFMFFKKGSRSLSFYYIVPYFIVHFPPFGWLLVKVLGVWLYARLHIPIGLFIVFPLIEFLEFLKLEKFEKSLNFVLMIFITFARCIPFVRQKQEYGLGLESIPQGVHYKIADIERYEKIFAKLDIPAFSYYWGDWWHCFFGMVCDIPLNAWIDFKVASSYAVLNYEDIKKFYKSSPAGYLKIFKKRYDLQKILLSPSISPLKMLNILKQENIKVVSFVDTNPLPAKCRKSLELMICGECKNRRFWIYKVP